jgi:phenylacetate-coenzyme A ligase PaaK-like adenylate-forming protein
MDRDQLLRILDEVVAFAPDLLFANPLHLSLLAEAAAANGLSIPRVDAILAGYQFFSHGQRRVLRQRFDAPIFDMYGATELAGSRVAIGCPAGRLHVNLEQAFVELTTGGRPVKGRELGRVTITTHNPTMPLIRYRIDDLARWELRPCDCAVGSSWPSLRLEGRARDAFVRPEGLVTTRDVDEALADLDVFLYQLIERDENKFTFTYIGEDPGELGPLLRDRLEMILNGATLELERVRELPLESGKLRFTIPRAP